MRKKLSSTFNDITSLDNLLTAWREFVVGKRGKLDVQCFGRHLMDNLALLRDDLAVGVYWHGGYEAFKIADPKPRDIHKASVRDRVLHHTVYRKLYPFFDRTFIAHSYSCRQNKGTHRALNDFQSFYRKVSRNNTKTCWVLKCDVRKFFASVDQEILLYILSTYISDEKILWLLTQIIRSFHSRQEGRGLPLGNLTSQLLVNVYMNEFDQYIKHHIKAKHYLRYADDFVVLSQDREWLTQQVSLIERFLSQVLMLSLHPNKVSIKTFASGVDYLGWVHFSDHRVLRNITARRMYKRLQAKPTDETTRSYLGLLKHGNTTKLRANIMDGYWLWRSKDDDIYGERGVTGYSGNECG